MHDCTGVPRASVGGLGSKFDGMIASGVARSQGREMGADRRFAYHARHVTSPERIEPAGWWERVRAAPATAVLALVCIVAFLGPLGVCVGGSEQPGDVLRESVWSMGACRDAMLQAGALELARIWVDGEWWRLATTGLLHGSWIHLILNIWSLFVVAEWAERAWGWPRFLVLFGLSSLGGCLASLAWAEAPMVVGASAGILGIAGALLVGRLWGRPKIRTVLEPISVRMLGGCLAVLIGIGFFVPLIAQAGHVGGLAGGVVLGLAWSHAKPLVQRSGVLVVGVLCAGLVSLGRWPEERAGFDEFVGYRYLEKGHHEEAAAALERALAARPDDAALQNAVAYALAEAAFDLDHAFELVTSALEEEPDNPDFLDTLGWVECQRGNFEAGLSALEQAEDAASSTIPEIAEHRAACGR